MSLHESYSDSTSEFLISCVWPRKTRGGTGGVYFSEKANGGRQRNSNIQQQQGRGPNPIRAGGLSSVIRAKILDDTANTRWTTRSFNCQSKLAPQLISSHRRQRVLQTAPAQVYNATRNSASHTPL
ncbi:hypothetical protein AVEN_227166-1 [Araneus ventricosus]|uniref:Uncharacterized protein n=1 Tax=Araneus ventricosus TaxID=182803 RepID=A0A4Y2BXR6_ARAVE|nr:hypothetical protein AVEN_227166-1 [Araneus ventricosus]